MPIFRRQVCYVTEEILEKEFRQERESFIVMRAKHGGYEDLGDEGRRLWDIAKSVIELPRRIRTLPLLDQLAVALILDRREFLPDGEFTVLQAVHHLGEERVKAAIVVERALMLDHDDEHE